MSLVPFQLSIVVTRYGVYPGGTPATAAAAHLLMAGVAGKDFGAAIRTVTVELKFRHGGPPPKPFKKADITRWHAHLATLPKVVLRAKAKQAVVQWATTVDARDFERGLPATFARFETLSNEVLNALESLRPRLGRLKGFDFGSFLATVTDIVGAVPRKKAAFTARIAQVGALARARQEEAKKHADPWSALDVDWAKQHPLARGILDDPFFWDPADDLSPIGNDTGADVLARYAPWQRRHKGDTSKAIAYVERLLAEWGMKEDSSQTALNIRDEAFIALAFAQIMLNGSASRAASSRALAALSRQQTLSQTWRDPQERLSSLLKMRRVLERDA